MYKGPTNVEYGKVKIHGFTPTSREFADKIKTIKQKGKATTTTPLHP